MMMNPLCHCACTRGSGSVLSAWRPPGGLWARAGAVRLGRAATSATSSTSSAGSSSDRTSELASGSVFSGSAGAVFGLTTDRSAASWADIRAKAVQDGPIKFFADPAAYRDPKTQEGPKNSSYSLSTLFFAIPTAAKKTLKKFNITLDKDQTRVILPLSVTD